MDKIAQQDQEQNIKFTNKPVWKVRCRHFENSVINQCEKILHKRGHFHESVTQVSKDIEREPVGKTRCQYFESSTTKRIEASTASLPDFSPEHMMKDAELESAQQISFLYHDGKVTKVICPLLATIMFPAVI